MFISISYVPGMCFGTIPSNGQTSLRGFAKTKFQKTEFTMEVGGRVQVSRICFGKSSQNSSKPVLIFGVVYHVYSVCIILFIHC